MAGYFLDSSEVMKMRKPRAATIAVNAILFALILIFMMVPIQIGPLRLAVLMLIPVLIAGQTQKPGVAIAAGTFLGLVSFITSVVMPTSVLSYIFNNPLVSVLPRACIGVVVYLTYRLIRKPIKNEALGHAVASFVSSILGVITNTGLVSLMLWIFYHGKDISGTVIDAEFMLGVILANFVIELIVCALLTPPISLAVKKTVERADRR